MAEGILVGLGLTEAELLAYRDAALQAFADGAKQMSGITFASGNGVQRSKTWQSVQGMSPRDLLREVKHALWRLNPETYADCAPGYRVTRAVIKQWH